MRRSVDGPRCPRTIWAFQQGRAAQVTGLFEVNKYRNALTDQELATSTANTLVSAVRRYGRPAPNSRVHS